jgi:hypothetical protein
LQLQQIRHIPLPIRFIAKLRFLSEVGNGDAAIYRGLSLPYFFPMPLPLLTQNLQIQVGDFLKHFTPVPAFCQFI